MKSSGCEVAYGAPNFVSFETERREVKNLKKYFPPPGGMLHAVNDVTLSIEAGSMLDVVGESGCGKSTLARTIIPLYESTSGQILFDRRDITKVNESGLRALRHDMQIIFQTPNSSCVLLPGKEAERRISISARTLLYFIFE